MAAIVPTISNQVFSETIEALTRTLAEGGYQLLLGQSAYRNRDEDALVEAFLGRRVDGLVLTGCGQSAALRTRLRRAGVPVVQTWDLPDGDGRTAPRVLDMAVGFSNVAAGGAAARHLIERGCRALGYVGADEERSRQRFDGYRAEIARAGLGDATADLALRAARRTVARLERAAVDLPRRALEEHGERRRRDPERPEAEEAERVDPLARQVERLAEEVQVERVEDREEDRLGDRGDEKRRPDHPHHPSHQVRIDPHRSPPRHPAAGGVSRTPAIGALVSTAGRRQPSVSTITRQRPGRTGVTRPA